MDGRIFHLRKRILDDLRHEWTIEEMADFVELSAPHLQKLFKVQSGTSPLAFVREMRLEKARDLLENTFRQIHIIGYEVEMPNDSHFTRDFKKRYGTTPTEYRKRHWERMQIEVTGEQE